MFECFRNASYPQITPVLLTFGYFQHARVWITFPHKRIQLNSLLFFRQRKRLCLNQKQWSKSCNLRRELRWNSNSFQKLTKTKLLWRPEFSTVKRDYSVKCGYALDFSDEVRYAFSINLKNKKALYEDGYIWDNPFSYGSNITPTKLTTVPQVNGQFYRCQIRYQLHGAFTPVNFKSHTLSVETQRLR